MLFTKPDFSQVVDKKETHHPENPKILIQTSERQQSVRGAGKYFPYHSRSLLMADSRQPKTDSHHEIR